MGVLSDLDTWTFDGINFPVLADGNRWPAAWKRKTIRKIDAILDGSRYVDIGGDEYEPLSKTAAFESAAARTTLAAKIGQDGNLANATGASLGTALLAEAHQLDADGIYYLDIVFEKV